MRARIIAGNWKMYTDAESAAALASSVVSEVGSAGGGEIILCPPFPFLPIVAGAIRGSEVKLGAQTMHDQKEGAYTGEVSGRMLRSVGCAYVIVGHSERRMMFAESDLDVSRRANAAVDAGLRPIVCVGETISEREAGRTGNVIERQIRAAFDGLFEFNVRNCVVAYEPIWAIGTSNAATPDQVVESHLLIRSVLTAMFGSAPASDVRIIYGGSLNASNAASLFAHPEIDGGLVGGASLDAAGFAAIVREALAGAVPAG